MGPGKTEGTGVSPEPVQSEQRACFGHNLDLSFLIMIINASNILSLQKDDPVDLSSDLLHEEQFTDEHGNVVTKVGHLFSFRFITVFFIECNESVNFSFFSTVGCGCEKGCPDREAFQSAESKALKQNTNCPEGTGQVKKID